MGCTEPIAESDSLVTFPNGPKTGDCLGDSLRSQNKDPAKYTLIKNSDGSLSFTSDGYPTLTLMQQTELGLSAKLDGSWMGHVPGIIKVTVSFSGSDSATMDVSVIGQDDIKCTEPITETDSLVSFPDGSKTGDCLGDSLRGQNKDPSKYTLVKNSDGSLSFTSDGYPTLKLEEQSMIMVV